MRTRRIDVSDPKLDQLEMKWWDDNAQTIETIWAQNKAFQSVVRLPYLNKMKSFFLNDAKRPYTVHEIGCGTGWVGRLVADKDLHIIGTDFSNGQLAIARQMGEGNHYLQYSLTDASTFISSDGILIHALLHHLSKEEMVRFVEQQFSKLPKGTKVFMYEPVFYTRTMSATLKDKIINKLIYWLRNCSMYLIKSLHKKDRELNDNMDKINYDAEINGWYISPKEVPFYEGELEAFVSSYLRVGNTYIVNKTDLEISQALSMYGAKNPLVLFRFLMKVARRLDEISFKGGFRNYVFPDQHLFTCFECIKK